MKNALTKAALVKELAIGAGISQKAVRGVLDNLVQIAYREAKGEAGFTLPGLCRMDTILRKARTMRNPRTGEALLLAEHRILRLRPLKKARLAVTPPPENLVTVQKEMPAQEILEDFSKAVSFRCPGCGQEIEAPAAAIGLIAPCPKCGKEVKIPSESEPGTMHGGPLPAVEEKPLTPDMAEVEEEKIPSPAPVLSSVTAPEQPVSPSAPLPAAAPVMSSIPATDFMKKTQVLDLGKTQAIDEETRKSQTIRIDLGALNFDVDSEPVKPSKRLLSFFCKNCHQEIEAPAEMAGQPAECPSCGMTFEVPFFSDPGTLHGSDLEEKSPDSREVQDMKSRTIRIEVPDDL